LRAFADNPPFAPWIYRIVINQARNRQRWWRRRRRSEQVSLDEHLQQFGDLESKSTCLPDRLLASKETASQIWQALDGCRSTSARPWCCARSTAALRRDRLFARRCGGHRSSRGSPARVRRCVPNCWGCAHDRIHRLRNGS
jgi:hypothetical protein